MSIAQFGTYTVCDTDNFIVQNAVFRIPDVHSAIDLSRRAKKHSLVVDYAVASNIVAVHFQVSRFGFGTSALKEAGACLS